MNAEQQAQAVQRVRTVQHPRNHEMRASHPPPWTANLWATEGLAIERDLDTPDLRGSRCEIDRLRRPAPAVGPERLAGLESFSGFRNAAEGLFFALTI